MFPCAEYILTFNFVRNHPLFPNDGATENKREYLSYFPYEPVTSALSLKVFILFHDRVHIFAKSYIRFFITI